MNIIKNIFSALLCALLLIPSAASADNKLTLEPFDIKAGETKVLLCLHLDSWGK